MMRLVILPTYNEKENIGELISKILPAMKNTNVLVVDDNSPDGTGAAVENIMRGDPRVFLIRREKRGGLGSAYMAGFKWALDRGYERVFTMDADLSHQPKYLPELDILLDDNDLSIGSRYVPGGGVEGWPLGRKLLSRSGNVYARKMIAIDIKDCTSGFMGISRPLVDKFLNSDIRSEGYSFLIELKNMALKQGFKVVESPIIFIDRKAGVSKISKKIIFEAFILAAALRLSGKNNNDRGNRLFKLADRYLGIPFVWFFGIFVKKTKQPPEDPKEILVIKLSAMGDSVLLIPSLRALRKRYPASNISVLCTRINEDIFLNCPYINGTILCDVKKIARNPLSVFSIFGRKKYDIAVDFDQWLRLSPLLAVLSGAKVRIGFKTEGQYRHYSYSAFTAHSRTKHEVETFLELLSLLGITGADDRLEFNVSEESKNRARELFKMILMDENQPFIVIHPETPMHGAQRHWPADKYIELGRLLTRNYRFKVLVTGTKNEISSNVKIVSAIGPEAKLLPPCGILTVAAVISKAKAVVCGNTGIMHLACALHRPVVAIHGPTDHVKWGPRGDKSRAVKPLMDCSPCLYLGFEYGCQTNKCMEAVTVEEVLKNLKDVAFS